MPAKFRWCAYVSDYPPHAEATSGNNYTLHGSPPFEVNGTKLGNSVNTYSGTIIALTDATGAPGIFPAAAGTQPNERGCAAGLVENSAGICVAPSAVGCNSNTLNLGVTSFTAGSEITIVGNGISQIWSRPVTATGCQKETFNGGTTNAPSADCRTTPGYAGDYFSGCAVLQYADVLCPAPWRVPTHYDFEKLDISMGGTGVTRTDAAFIDIHYVGQWGGHYRGACYPTGAAAAQGYYGIYLTCSAANTPLVSMRVMKMLSPTWAAAPSQIQPSGAADCTSGFGLRCVR
jgi:hypothetical protein